MYLERMINNPFADIRVGIERREKFVHFHILSMKGNNPGGVLDNCITETLPLHLSLTQNLSLRKYVAGSGKGSTLTVNLIIKEFIDIARDLESMCKIKYKKKSPIYLEAFPLGFKEYQTLSQSNFMPLLERLLQFSDHFNADVGIEYKNKISDIKTRFDVKLVIREDIKQDARGARPDFEIIWNKIVNQLYKNTLCILLANLDKPDILLSYFDQSIVNFRHKTNNGITSSTYNLTIPPSSSKTAAVSFSAADTLLIINNGNVAISYYGASTKDELPKTAPIEILAGEEAEVTAISLGSPGNKFLIIVNNTAADAEVKIALL